MNLQRTGSVWDRSNRNGINNNWERLERVISSVNDLVVNGQLTPSQYAQLLTEINSLISRGDVSIYDIDKNKGLLDQSFLSDELLEQIAGTSPVLSTLADGVVTTHKISERAVHPNQTTFFETNANLFDGNYVDGWLGQATHGGVARYSSRSNGVSSGTDYKGKTAVIPVSPNTTYSLKVSADSDTIRVGTTVSYPKFVSPTHRDEDLIDEEIGLGSNDKERTFTTNSNARFLLVNTSHQGVEYPLIVVRGQSIPDDVYPNDYQKIPKKYLNLGQTLHNLNLVHGTVLINGSTVFRLGGESVILRDNIKLSPGYVVGLHDYSDYTINVVRWSQSGDYLGSYGVINYPTKITDGYIHNLVVRKTDESNISMTEIEEIEKLLFIDYGENYNDISGLEFVGGTLLITGEFKYRDSGETFIMRSPIYLKKGQVIKMSDNSKYDYNVGKWDADNNYLGSYGRRTTDTVVDTYGRHLISVRKINGQDFTEDDLKEASEIFTIESQNVATNAGTINSNQFYLTDDINHDFEMLYTPNYGGDSLNKDVQYQRIIDDLDTNIIPGNSDYISKKQYGESKNGQPLYYYHLNPYIGEVKSGSTGTASQAPANPKLLLVAGLHGNEKTAVFGAYGLINMIVNNHRENKLMDYLRRNLEIYYIPVANPDGFNQNRRQTPDGVDLNRDFSNFNETETRAIRDLTESIDDLTFVIDSHNMFFRDGYMAYSTSDDVDVQKTTLRATMKGAREIQKKYENVPQSPNHHFTYITTPGAGTMTKWVGSKSIPALTLETIRINEWETGQNNEFSESTIVISSTVLAETIKALIKMVR